MQSSLSSIKIAFCSTLFKLALEDEILAHKRSSYEELEGDVLL